MSAKRSLSMIRNTLLNYAGQAYAIVIGILIQPFYLGHLGAEAYGLIGFFAVLQTWLLLLDVGLSPALVRQVAHIRGAQGETYGQASLLRSFELILLPLTLLGSLTVYAGSTWIAGRWLNVHALSPVLVAQCISLMGLLVALRLYGTLYRSALQGLELHGWINGINVFVTTLRYFGGLLLVAKVSQDPLVFFEFQVAVSLFETLMLGAKSYLWMEVRLLTRFCWDTLRPVIPFALSMSFTSGLWIIVTQLDKVLLSSLMPLRDYGYFSLVALISGGILSLVNPLAQSLLPRMTMLIAEGRHEDMQQLYLKANRFVCVLLLPMVAVIAAHGHDLILAWSGDAVAARWCQPVLVWYVLGAGMMAVSSFQFYLQYAHGQLQLHVWYTVITALVSIPLVAGSAYLYGVLGVALCWFGLRVALFLILPPIVHRRFGNDLHWPWLRDTLQIAALSGAGLLLSEPVYALLARSGERLSLLLALASCGLITLTLVGVGSAPALLRLFKPSQKPSV
ncbi:lipopolysaccharide biosynthesis protein [Pseudomonas sp. SCB32]|uniref:lipopolysaccharide biosynthesis protein n=1 Tax=Pseudomonas sp. SCB32 TaxID=2653853 RepID=UPI0012642FC8|nr:oligosaccharide flippase family protein [Pseudomonas sp. SCB32]